MTTALVGGQFGSEGKGLIAGHIARAYLHHVRVGAANAGHTVYTKQRDDRNCDCNVPAQEGAGMHSYGCACFKPEKHVMQQVPCAAYANPDAQLYIGPGAQISPEIFHRELADLAAWRKEWGYEPIDVLVDPRAHVITDEHIAREQESGLAERIGSTSTIAREGIGAAQAARVMRDESCVQAIQHYTREPFPSVKIGAVPSQLCAHEDVLLEGTQGTGLSLTTGPFPFVTSRNTTAAGLCADTGVPPTKVDDVILVCRSYPIRVAGNSGPFHPESREIEWGEIGIDPENERTTVTKLVRRVATFSMAQVAEAAQINGATSIALTFADYLDPNIAGKHSLEGELLQDAHPAVAELIQAIETATGVPVMFIGTGPHSVIERFSL